MEADPFQNTFLWRKQSHEHPRALHVQVHSLHLRERGSVLQICEVMCTSEHMYGFGDQAQVYSIAEEQLSEAI